MLNKMLGLLPRTNFKCRIQVFKACAEIACVHKHPQNVEHVVVRINIYVSVL